METMNEIAGYMSPVSDRNDDEKDSNSDMETGEEEDVVDSDDERFVGPARGPKSGIVNSVKNSIVNSVRKVTSPEQSIERFKYIPMRLTEEERSMLNVLENALEVCEYTDVVDVTFSHTRKSKMSNNLNNGEKLLSGKTLTDNVPLFRDLFEIARRYKIMNPSKMRSTYGKLMYILMDTQSHVIKSELKVTWVKPLKTVYSVLERKKFLFILNDPLWERATMSISNEMGEMNQRELGKLQEGKQQAVAELVKKYSCEALPAAEIQRIIDSIADNEAYLAFNVRPVEKIIAILKQSFNPAKAVDPFSLHLTTRPLAKKMFNHFSSFGYSMGYSSGGACLSHDHATQYKFVLQSFTLWHEIMFNMPKLWVFADEDMTTQDYRLVDTGQGYQRLQSSPNVRQEMSRILRSVQSKCGSWVGLSVVHLGDRDVPNALVFIDKYTQVPRILAPIVQCIDQLPNLVEDSAFHHYVSEEWGSIDGLRLQILSDFFKHGFDGSGDDGGSCIDGRLTSAWNWCSKLHKKPYYYVFMFTGFQGFDGDWKEN